MQAQTSMSNDDHALETRPWPTLALQVWALSAAPDGLTLDEAPLSLE